jgi:glycosyltransferase involved in cell wall biosynthesis
MRDNERVTVVIPASNEEGFLGACLDSVRAQEYGDLQILVVDGCSTDGTRDVVRMAMKEDDRVELLENGRRNIPSSMNMGLAHARGRWLVRVDAHSTIGPDYVSTAVERLREDRWGGVGGRKDGVGRTAAGQAIAVAMGSRLGVGGSTYHHGTTPQEVDHLPFGAYPTELVRRIGGWDENLVANEDFEFDHRLREAGHVLLFDPRMVIRWHCRQSIGDLYRQYHRYGKGKVDVTWLHPESLRPRHVGPPAFVAYTALGLALNVRHPARLGLMLAPYAAAVLAGSAVAGRELDSGAARVRLPAAFVAMHVGWGTGFWSQLGRTSLRRARGVRRKAAA